MRVEALIKKFIDFSIGPIGAAAISMITVPILTYFIEPSEYGKASMFTLAITILQLMVFLGMDQAYSRKYYVIDNKSGLFLNAILPSYALVFALEIIIILFRNNIADFLFSDSDEIGCIIALMIILPALAVERFLMLSLRMEQRGKTYSAMSILIKFLILISVIAFLFCFEKSYKSVIYGTTAAQVFFSIVLCFIQHKQLKIKLSYIDLGLMKSLLRFGLPLVPTTIIGWVLNGMDKVMLRFFSDYSALGIYAVASTVASVLTIVQACFANYWIPLAHQWNSEKVDTSLYEKVGKIVSCLMALCLSLVLLFKDIIFLLFKSDYNNAVNIVPFLLLVPVMYTISEVTVIGLYFKEKTEWTVIVSIVSATMNLILNYCLIPPFGAYGAAIATGVSYMVFFWCRTLLSRRIWFKFSIKNYCLISIVVFIDCFVNTVLKGTGIYIINILFLLIISYIYKDVISEGLYTLKKVLIKK